MKTLSKLIGLALLLVVFSCESKSDTAGIPKPQATGKVGEILVIIDNTDWSSEIGDTIRAIFETPYPMLPQTESSFKLLHIANSSFLPVMQKHRNILLISMSDEFTEAKLTISRDLWSQPQIVLNALGSNASDIANILDKRRETMMALYEQAEIDRQTKSAERYSDKTIKQAIKERFNINLDVPVGYNVIGRDVGFMCMESQTKHNSVGIIIYSYPFVDDSTFTLNYLVNKRDSILKEKFHGTRDSSWMTTTKYIMPQLEIKKFRGLEYGEMRGLWELVNDYMGGPFVSRSYINRKTGYIVTVEGYVYAPRFDKRDYLRGVLGIVNTFSLDDDETPSNETPSTE